MPVITPGGGGGGPPNGLVVKDLGVHTLVSAIGGPVALLAATSGEYVELTFGTAGFVAPDNQSMFMAFQADVSSALYFAQVQSSTVLSALQTAFKPGWVVRNTAAINLYCTTNDFVVGTAIPAWQANHVYAAAPSGPIYTTFLDNTCGVTQSGEFWSSSGGTSGGSLPNFAGNIGGTVNDNGITWTDEGAVPTLGSIHLYALIAAPS